ncbi:hypothetical protein DPX16_21033 [Anabarilius grahami]|uniref:Uncharacterized protein n=1 Tax=Anabarilius grahami TaxID=495550 RepID=A0A3N0YW87_ANAGA|nr:hypothetical protein DPX16_21033 [Anabarilius grahami]
MGLPKAEAFFKNEEELEVIYPTEVKSAKDKKKMKEIILRENPEILLSDYTGPEDNRVRCNLLFFTEHPSVWHTILCSAMTCRRKGGISKGRQLTLEGDNDTKLTVNLYHNGTVMVQGPETSLNEFQRNFKNLKLEVQKIKKDPEVKRNTEVGLCNTIGTNVNPSSRTPITNRHVSTPASPKIKALKDNIAELEQDFFLFKEETTNNLHQLLNLNSHHSVQQLQQLCSAVRQLEEDNQELRQELRRVREELVIREQHGQTLERLLEETRNQLHTKQHQQCVSTQTHSTSSPERVPNSTPHQKSVSTQPQSSLTPATRQSPQAPQSLKRKENSNTTQSHPPRTTTSPMSTSREQKSKDNIVIFCDSNGHHLDPRRLFPGRSVKKFWCPTSHSALRLLQEEGMRLFAKTIKESALKSPQKTHPDREERVSQTDSYAAVVAGREFKLSSFTIPQFKGSEHILTHYAGPLEDGLSLTSTALKVIDKPFNHPFPLLYLRLLFAFTEKTEKLSRAKLLLSDSDFCQGVKCVPLKLTDSRSSPLGLTS